MPSKFEDLFSALQSQLQIKLSSSRKLHQHPVAKGEASEEGWVKLLGDHLPNRYEVDSAFIVDSKGGVSDQIDIVIYDHQYTPIWYNEEHERFIPAESVYAVFEVKQSLSKGNVDYAGEKAASVRSLHRTNNSIVHAGGEYDPRPLFDIVAGILTYSSDWSPPLGDSLENALNDLDETNYLGLGCAVSEGAFEVSYDGGEAAVASQEGGSTLVSFVLNLLQRLQGLGTAPAIDYGVYNDHIAE